jgi:transcriptional regulator with XRE-family HTH domain
MRRLFHIANVLRRTNCVVTLGVTFFACGVSRLALQKRMAQTHPLFIYARNTGTTITKIAAASGCSRMTIYRLMRGEQNPTLDLLRRISSATNGVVTPNDFLPVDQGRA